MNKEATHTPGPWILDTSHRATREGITIWSEDVIIADVVDDQHNNKEANARLISAAPEMLNALKLVLDPKWDGDETKIRQAIAKAIA
jgi:hypothetical protein